MKPIRKNRFIILAALFLLSASCIALEVSLTRLFSFLYTHSYVYIIISISMAGLGLGAVSMSILPERFKSGVLRWILPFPGILLFLVIFSSLNQGLIYFSLIAALLIFFCAGAFQIVVFRDFKIKTGKLYATDLSGAALGSITSYIILNATGGLNSTIVMVSSLSIACITIYILKFKYSKKIILQASATLCIIALLFIIGSVSNLIPRKSLMKEMTVMLEDENSHAAIAETRWSAFGRVDLVETDNPLFKTMFIDGAAGTKMIKMENGLVDRPTAETLLYKYMGGVPLLAVDENNKNRALIVGSGGGIDVVTALLAGYGKIDAVEINPDFIDIAMEYEDYNGGIYTQNENVNLIQGEGRSFIRSVEKKYNLIQMSLPIIKSSRNFGNQALTENYLFTCNAFGEYLKKLESDGIILIVAHYPNELMKLAVNAAAAFETEGMAAGEIMKHIITIGDDDSPVIIIKKSPFTLEETQLYYTLLDQMGLRGSTNFIPGFDQRSKNGYNNEGDVVRIFEFNPALYNYSAGSWDLDKIAEINTENVGKVSDDSPFFYQMSKSVPSEIRITAIVAALILAVCFILFSGRNIMVKPGNNPGINISFLLSFGAIGAGYMFIEISYLQKFIFYWQHQTLALAVVLSLILISSGAGSFISYKFRTGRLFHIVMLILLLFLLLNIFITNPILTASDEASAAIKLLCTLLIIGPPFVLMGMPFPIMLEMNLKLNGSRKDFPWMMSFNSIASLCAGVFSMVTAMKIGYTYVLAIGILFYFPPLLFSISQRTSSEMNNEVE